MPRVVGERRLEEAFGVSVYAIPCRGCRGLLCVRCDRTFPDGSRIDLSTSTKVTFEHSDRGSMFPPSLSLEVESKS